MCDTERKGEDMIRRVPRYSGEEFSRRGKEIYARVVRPNLTPEDIGKFVEVDIESEDYEVAPDCLTAANRLLERQPDAQMWLERVGYVAAYAIGRSLSRRDEL